MKTTPPLTGVQPVLQYPVRADGGLDVPALQAACSCVTVRHPVSILAEACRQSSAKL